MTKSGQTSHEFSVSGEMQTYNSTGLLLRTPLLPCVHVRSGGETTLSASSSWLVNNGWTAWALMGWQLAFGMDTWQNNTLIEAQPRLRPAIAVFSQYAGWRPETAASSPGAIARHPARWPGYLGHCALSREPIRPGPPTLLRITRAARTFWIACRRPGVSRHATMSLGALAASAAADCPSSVSTMRAIQFGPGITALCWTRSAHGRHPLVPGVWARRTRSLVATAAARGSGAKAARLPWLSVQCTASSAPPSSAARLSMCAWFF